MRKLFYVCLVSFSLFFTSNVRAAENNVNVVVNGSPVMFTESTGFPYLDENNRMLVPLRVTMETAGATVDWDEQTQTGLIQTDVAGILVPINSNFIIVNDIEVEIDTSAKNINGKIYLPIRAILEASAFSVEWDNTTQTIFAVKTEENTNLQNAIEVRDMLNKHWIYVNGRWQKEGDWYVEQGAINDILNDLNEEIDWDNVEIQHNIEMDDGEYYDLDGLE